MRYGYPEGYKNRHESLALNGSDFGFGLYATVGEVLEILLDAGYECVIRREELGTDCVVVEYNHNRNKGLGNETAYWLTDAEEEVLAAFRDVERDINDLEECFENDVVYEVVVGKDDVSCYFRSKEKAIEYLGDEEGYINAIKIVD